MSVPKRRGSPGRAATIMAFALCVGPTLGPGLASAAAAPVLRTGFLDADAAAGPDAPTWMARGAAVGAQQVRLNVSWDVVAPARPADPKDPGSPEYRFAAVDAQVRAATAAHLAPILNVSKAPSWAEGPDRAAGVGRGSWKPDPAAFGAFMTAVATRYAGSFTDPATGAVPRVRTFQLWNEPNLDTYLAPQWEHGKPFAPTRFRELVNAGSAAIRAAQRGATVVTGGLAPFGDYRTTSGKRLPPVAFLRSMLCLDAKLRRTCRATSRFDVLAHHPYAVRKPSSGALNADDATIPDLRRLTRVTAAARKAGTLRATPRLWVTEVSYDSSPPDPDGVPTATLARWISELLWRLSSQGAETVIWYLVRDQAPVPSFAATYQSGMYLADGTRKPSAQSFRFPLAVTGRTARTLKVWLRSPVAGRAAVQVRRGGAWRSARTVGVRAAGVRTLSVPRARTTAVRAVVGGEASYAWSVR